MFRKDETSATIPFGRSETTALLACYLKVLEGESVFFERRRSAIGRGGATWRAAECRDARDDRIEMGAANKCIINWRWTEQFRYRKFLVLSYRLRALVT